MLTRGFNPTLRWQRRRRRPKPGLYFVRMRSGTKRGFPSAAEKHACLTFSGPREGLSNQRLKHIPAQTVHADEDRSRLGRGLPFEVTAALTTAGMSSKA